MPHDPVHDHIFGDREEAPPAAVAPRRHVPLAGVFGAHEAVRDLDLPSPPRIPRDKLGRL